MKNNKNLKGFTLVELVIVMAIFSLIMFGALRTLDPLEKIVKHANTQESSSAVVDNIKHYFEDSLRYAEHVEVYRGALIDEDGDSIAVDDSSTADEEIAVKSFLKRYYEDRVTGNSSGSPVPLTGKVRMLKVKNDDDGTGNYGIVDEYEWTFTAGTSYQRIDDTGKRVEPVIDPATGKQTNVTEFHTPASLDASKTKLTRSVINKGYYDNYAFTFIPGYCESVAGNVQYVDINSDGTSDNSDKELSTTSAFFSMSVVVNPKDEGAFDMSSDKMGASYMLSNINFSFVNINSAFVTNKFYYPVYYKETESGAVSTDHYDNTETGTFGEDGHDDYAYKSLPNRATIFNEVASTDANYSDCIYFIYTLPDQM